MNRLNYIGSKHTLCPTIMEIIKNEISNLKELSFLDMFAGTGSISFNFQDIVKRSEANDLEYYSFIINYALIKCAYSSKLEALLKECNELESIEGLIYNNYSENDDCERMYFTNENAKKCDAIREHIEQLKLNKLVTEEEYYYLLASLIVSIDKVANTSCVYGAYLKAYKKTALKELILIPIHTKTDIKVDVNKVHNVSAEELSKKGYTYDIVYMDPPYNQRQYSANYCPLNYIALYNKNVNLRGKTGIIDGYNKSKFCSKLSVKESFKTILDNIDCKYVFISYNNEGLLNFEELKQLLSVYGTVKIYKIPYKKFKAQQNVDGDMVYEYLWFIDKTQVISELIEEIEYIII